MIRRVFWLGMGVAVGVVVARKVTGAVQAYSPAGLAGSARNSAAGALESVRDFIAEVRAGMAEREEQIAEAFARGVSLEDMDLEDSHPYRSDRDLNGRHENQNGAGPPR
jgi:hypothetical protein